MPSKPERVAAIRASDFPDLSEGRYKRQGWIVEVKFKPVSGREDQAGGVIWHAKDAKNYYIARANALEDNVTIYQTIKGRRTETKRVNMKVASNPWHTFRVDFQHSNSP